MKSTLVGQSDQKVHDLCESLEKLNFRCKNVPRPAKKANPIHKDLSNC